MCGESSDVTAGGAGVVRLDSTRPDACDRVGAHLQSEEAHVPQVHANPTPEDLAGAISLLRPGGWAYVEVEGSSSLRRSGRGRSARGYANALRKLGLVDVGAYLHWPDFGSCRAIAALDDAAAVRQALARGRRGGRAGIVRRLAPALAATHLLAAVDPCASAVGRRVHSEEGGG